MQAQIVLSMSDDEMCSYIRAILRAADTTGTTRIENRRFRNAVEESRLGLDLQKVRILMSCVSQEADGTVVFENSVAHYARAVREIHTKCPLAGPAPVQSTRAAGFTFEEFGADCEASIRQYDTAGTGLVSLALLRQALESLPSPSAPIGATPLSPSVVQCLLSEALPVAAGKIEYNKFYESFFEMIAQLAKFGLETEVNRCPVSQCDHSHSERPSAVKSVASGNQRTSTSGTAASLPVSDQTSLVHSSDSSAGTFGQQAGHHGTSGARSHHGTSGANQPAGAVEYQARQARAPTEPGLTNTAQQGSGNEGRKYIPGLRDKLGALRNKLG